MVDWSARTKQVAAIFGLGDWFWRQINTESKFNPDAYNAKSGATGIAQIIPRYHPTVNARDPEASLQYAANWMKTMIANYTKAGKSNPTAYALAAYNWGPGNVSTWNGQRSTLPKETQTYIDAALGSDWAGSGSVTIPGLPSEKPSWWPDGWDWPPSVSLPSVPKLPEMPTADSLAQLIWDTFDGLRQRIKDQLVANAKLYAATLGGPIAFWVVGQALVGFGLIGLVMAGVQSAKNSAPGKLAIAVATRGQSLVADTTTTSVNVGRPTAGIRIRRAAKVAPAPKAAPAQGAARPSGSEAAFVKRAASNGAQVAGAVL